MKRSLVIAGCLVLCTACSELTPPAAPSATTSASPAASSGVAVVPFKGRLDGRYGTPSGQFPLISESIVATGQATHLGRHDLALAETVNLLQGTAVGTFTFTAANGDTVYGSFTGRAQPGPLVAIVETATILGGTGRFDGATGHFTIDRVFDPVSRTTTGSFEGSIAGVGGTHHQ